MQFPRFKTHTHSPDRFLTLYFRRHILTRWFLFQMITYVWKYHGMRILQTKNYYFINIQHWTHLLVDIWQPQLKVRKWDRREKKWKRIFWNELFIIHYSLPKLRKNFRQIFRQIFAVTGLLTMSSTTAITICRR